ncbi:MAG TPA: hypothetical protein DCP61_03945 [Treponema sp.]|nr:hypothetical protein [Treponema sp.]
MPVKLIFSIALMVLVATFTGFNLGNKCDLWIFHTFKDVPVFVTVIASFVCGVLLTLPFTFGKSKKEAVKKALAKAEKNREKEERIREKAAAKEAAKEAKSSSEASHFPLSSEGGNSGTLSADPALGSSAN